MQVTVKIKLEPTKDQVRLIKATTREYIRLVNQIVADFVESDASLKYTSKTVVAELSSAVKNQAIQDAKSIFKKYKKNVHANSHLKPEDRKEIKVPILKKPAAIWNNQNYSISGNIVSFPVIISDKSKRIEAKAILTDYQRE
jgi:predicted RNA-binding protein